MQVFNNIVSNDMYDARNNMMVLMTANEPT